MQMLYGYDVAADLQPQSRYDEVVTALGGGGRDSSPTRRRSARRCAGPSTPACPTWST